MSLELADFIKDLVATNPLGSDPKSQGDDHLRLIKEVLKNQFPGFTDGVGISKTESQLNAMLAPAEGGFGGTLNAALATNIDTVPAVSRLYGIGGATPGTKPPGATGSDTLLVLAFEGNFISQLCFVKATSSVWVRHNLNQAGYSAWVPLYTDSGWLAPTLSASISNGSPAPRYRKIGNLVEFYVNVTTSLALVDIPICTFASGYRPAVVRTFHGSFVGNNLQRQPLSFQLTTAGVLECIWATAPPTASTTTPYSLAVQGTFFVG